MGQGGLRRAALALSLFAVACAASGGIALGRENAGAGVPRAGERVVVDPLPPTPGPSDLSDLLRGVPGAPDGSAQERSSGATIFRDRLGVSHIVAPSERAAAYAVGYASATERPFLTAGIRLLAQGRSAELLGPSALPADEAMRRDFYEAADVERQFTRLPQHIRELLEAYARGVQKGFDVVMSDPTRRPLLFDLLGYRPEPWRAQDSLAVAMLFSYVVFAGEGGAGQLRNAALLDRLEQRFGARRGLAIWSQVLWRDDPRGPTVIPAGQGNDEPRALREERPGAQQVRLARELAPVIDKLVDERLREAQGLDAVLKRLPLPKIGSYAVAIGGTRTASGGGLLLGSPQAGLTAPPVFWQVGIRTPERDCLGMSIPGFGPWIGIGWCNGHAWSLVAGNLGEQVDNYVERLKPGDRRAYLYRGQWRQMTVRQERFRIGACVPPLCERPMPPGESTLTIEETVHGPVVARDPDGRFAVTQRRAQRGMWARSLLTIDGWNKARSLAEFERATDVATGTYNLVYADARGHILYRLTGLQPVRARGFDRRLPAPGDGSAEWRGFLRPRELPRVVDPRPQLIVVNQGTESKPSRWWPNSSAVAVGQASRVAQNRVDLLRIRRADGDDLEAANPRLLERRDGITPVFAAILERALRRSRDPELAQALALLREWQRSGFARVDRDGDGFYDAPAIAIFGADDFNLPSAQYPRYFWEELLRLVFADELGDGAKGSSDRGSFAAPGGWLQRLSLLKIALDGRLGRQRLVHQFVDDISTPRRETAGELIRRAAKSAIERLAAEFGTRDMRLWMRKVPQTSFTALGVVAPPPIPGFDHGTYSQIVDPRAGEGRYILPPGNAAADSAIDIAAAQAGRYPPHFADQRERYAAYGFFPMNRFGFERDPEQVIRLPEAG